MCALKCIQNVLRRSLFAGKTTYILAKLLALWVHNASTLSPKFEYLQLPSVQLSDRDRIDRIQNEIHLIYFQGLGCRSSRTTLVRPPARPSLLAHGLFHVFTCRCGITTACCYMAPHVLFCRSMRSVLARQMWARAAHPAVLFRPRRETRDARGSGRSRSIMGAWGARGVPHVNGHSHPRDVDR